MIRFFFAQTEKEEDAVIERAFFDALRWSLRSVLDTGCPNHYQRHQDLARTPTTTDVCAQVPEDLFFSVFCVVQIFLALGLISLARVRSQGRRSPNDVGSIEGADTHATWKSPLKVNRSQTEN